MSVTLRDIAQAADVSPTTVSKVLNGKFHEARITVERAEHVRNIASRLGYRRNMAARATATGRFDTLGLLKVEGRGVGLGQLPEGLLTGVERRATQRGQRLSFAVVPHDVLETRRIPMALRESWGDGVLIFGCWVIPDVLRDLLLRMKLPMVAVGIKQAQDAIYADEYRAARTATEYLLQLGHRRIAYVKDRHQVDWIREDRERGFREAMEAAGLPARSTFLEPEFRRVQRHDYQAAMAERRAFLSGDQRPTAVLADTTEVAYPLQHAAALEGLSDPRRFSLLTFHDVVANQLGPNITTMMLTTTELGEQAVDILLERVQQRSVSVEARVMAYELVEGHTTAPPIVA